MADLFMAFEPLAGRRQVEVAGRKTAADFARLLRRLSDEWYPQAAKIVLACDNLNTHAPASLYEAFEPAEARRLAGRFEWHHTPRHGSWLNVAEVELSVVARQCLGRRIPDMPTLGDEAEAWERRRNAAVVKVDWRFTTAGARVKRKKLYPTLQLQRTTRTAGTCRSPDCPRHLWVRQDCFGQAGMPKGVSSCLLG